ncbi:serine hydrolase domain-containing protein [Streptomyces sp. NPDC006798]|uniref:serine hydrolase domain-containing protein n=1 Tax=Streptomyces sp. NPDC006798 TaxID=3155462 RepID=UPI0033D2723C
MTSTPAPRPRRRTASIALVTGALAATALAAAPAQATAGSATTGTTAAGTTNGAGTGTGTGTTNATDRPATRAALTKIVTDGLPGVTATAQDANGVWRAGIGLGDLRTGEKRGEKDRFRIASITKTFVATVLLQLEAEGRLDLDDTVEKWLPGLVHGEGHDGRKITVRQLLNHTSGIFDYLGDPEFNSGYAAGQGFLKNRHASHEPEELVGYAMRNPPTQQPGGVHQYSNTNYVLAALIIEAVAGEAYEDEIRERIIEPLGLRATLNPGDRSTRPEPGSRAYSTLTHLPGPRIYDITSSNASSVWGAGDMISDAADLNRFFRALLQGGLLPPEQLKAMKTPAPNPMEIGYGYGLGLEQYTTSCGTAVWGHTGGWKGSLTMSMHGEDGRRSLTFNTNGDWRFDGLMPPVEAEFCGTAPKAAADTGADTGATEPPPALRTPLADRVARAVGS